MLLNLQLLLLLFAKWPLGLLLEIQTVFQKEIGLKWNNIVSDILFEKVYHLRKLRLLAKGLWMNLLVGYKIIHIHSTV